MVGHIVADTCVKALDDKSCSTAGNINVLTDQVGVHSSHEVALTEVDVIVGRAHLGSEIVTQPFGVHAEFQILQGADAGAAALTHFAAVNRHETVYEHIVGRTVGLAGEFKHGRPKERMEVHDVLTDEVDLLGLFIIEELPEIKSLLFGVIHEAGVIADRSIQPDIEILTRSVGDRDAEIGFIARNIPVTKFAFG